MKDISCEMFDIFDPPGTNIPCTVVAHGEGHFEVTNPTKKTLTFIQIDACLFNAQDGGKCDFGLFDDATIILVELKKIDHGTNSNSQKRTNKKRDAYKQLIDTLDLFINNELNLGEIDEMNLIVIAAVLDENGQQQSQRSPAILPNSQQLKARFERYNATLLIGNTYQFANTCQF